MKITHFDKQNLPSVSADIKAALKSVEDKYGIKLNSGSISFSSESFSVKITAAISGKSDVEVINAKWKLDFDRKAFFLEHAGLPKNSYGKEFQYSGKTCKLVGAQPRKDNLIVQHAPGLFWAVPQEQIIAALTK